MNPDTKFCQHCGAKISADATFCPKCGAKQPVSNDSQSVNSAPTHNYDLLVQPPKGQYSDIKIAQFEREMGFNDDPNDFVMAEKGHEILRAELLGPIGAASVKRFVVCFKDDGILMLGINVLNHLCNKNNFIPANDIVSVRITHGHTVEIITNTSKLKINIMSQPLLGKWRHLRENRKHLAELVDKY